MCSMSFDLYIEDEVRNLLSVSVADKPWKEKSIERTHYFHKVAVTIHEYGKHPAQDAALLVIVANEVLEEASGV